MKVSVLVSCYNYRDFVTEAIESALAQTLPPSEIVVVDDGSTDGSGELLQQKYGGHPLVKLVRTPNRGQLSAFVAAFEASSGDIVTFLDADDRYKPGYLQLLAGIYSRRPTVDQVFCNLQLQGGPGGLWLPIARDEDWGTGALRVGTTLTFHGVATSGISLRRSLGQRILRVPESHYDDWRTRADDSLVVGGALCGAHRYVIAEPHVEYRFHERNNWAGRDLSAVDNVRHFYRLARLVAWYRDAGGLDHHCLRWAHLEFRTKPRPRPGEFLFYFWLQFRAPVPPRDNLRRLWDIAKHYAASLSRRLAGKAT